MLSREMLPSDVGTLSPLQGNVSVILTFPVRELCCLTKSRSVKERASHKSKCTSLGFCGF